MSGIGGGHESGWEDEEDGMGWDGLTIDSSCCLVLVLLLAGLTGVRGGRWSVVVGGSTSGMDNGSDQQATFISADPGKDSLVAASAKTLLTDLL